MYRRLREVALVLSLVAIAVLVLRANQRRPAELSWFDRAVLWVTAPVESAITGGVRAIARAWRNYVWLVDAREEVQTWRDVYDLSVADPVPAQVQLASAIADAVVRQLFGSPGFPSGGP